MTVPVTTPTATGEKTAEGSFKIYEPEMQLILFLRQHRNLLAVGETLRFEVEIEQDSHNINLANLARFRRLVLAV